MSLEDRSRATAKNIEGKIQDAVGQFTGDPKDQIEGKAKQQQAAAMHAAEDVKDDIKRTIDRV